MHEAIEEIERPPEDVVAGFEEIPSPVPADAGGGDCATMEPEIGPVYQGARVAGTAVTVQSPPGDNLMVHRALKLARPGDVLVVDARGYPLSGIWGELLSLSAAVHGIAGTVVDGGVRDVREVSEAGYPVFSRFVCPNGSSKAAAGSINVPVTCGGVTVAPGDVVVGDDDGVVVVDGTEAESVLAQSREKLEAEQELKERVRDGEYLYDVGGYDETFEQLDVEVRSGNGRS